MKYKIITSLRQYYNYCDSLEELLTKPKTTKEEKEEIDLLTLLIENYDEQNSPLDLPDPIMLIKLLMKENNLKAIELANILGVSKGLMSDILNYKKGLSKEIIRKISLHFKVRQEALNREYALFEIKKNAAAQ
jgi:HTH-type transcriptional regulator / antitoxin HigA